MSKLSSNNQRNRLALRNTCKTYNQGVHQITILDTIDVEFHDNSSYAIEGISGSGKSTIINLLAGLDTPTTGSVFFNEDLISASLSQSSFHLEKIGLIFQFPYLINELTVLENIMTKGFIKNMSIKAMEERAHYLLDLVGLTEKKSHSPAVLSGGEQQRVALARALFFEPVFLLADEPTAHLDEKNRDMVLELILNVYQKNKTGLIIASHDPVVTQSMQEIFQLKDKQLKRREG